MPTIHEVEGHPARIHQHAHTEPSHHVGPCGPGCRLGLRKHGHRISGEHLYRGRGSIRARREFKARYGKRAAYVYGATVGKVRREQRAARRRTR